MPKPTKETTALVAAAVRAVIPPADGWSWRLTPDARGLILTVAAGPVDVPRVDAVINRTAPRGWCEINPTAYEDRADLPVAAILRALNSQQTVQFDARGNRTGTWYVAILRFGDWTKPYRVVVNA